MQIIEDAGGIIVSRSQLDKLGFDWLEYKVNDVTVRQEYVEQETPYGTRDYPITYTVGASLIDNAYYLVDGVRHVCMAVEYIEF